MASDSPDDDGTDAGLVARSGDGDNAQPYSISEISALLKRTVEDRFGFVRLRGELSGVKRAASGHLYAALKDDKAVLDAVMWRGNCQRLPFAPEDGLEVIATGKLTQFSEEDLVQCDAVDNGCNGGLMDHVRRPLTGLQLHPYRT